MNNARHKNGNWNFPTLSDGRIEKWEYVSISVLMDIRDELQTLNRLLGCQNFTGIPATLRSIKRNTARRKAKR